MVRLRAVNPVMCLHTYNIRELASNPHMEVEFKMLFVYRRSNNSKRTVEFGVVIVCDVLTLSLTV